MLDQMIEPEAQFDAVGKRARGRVVESLHVPLHMQVGEAAEGTGTEQRR